MTTLFIDLETYSEVPIKDGTHRYAEGATITLFAYALDDGPVKVWDVLGREVSWIEPLTGDREAESTHTMPEDLWRALCNESTELAAHNVSFDRTILRHAGSVVERAAAKQLHRWRSVGTRNPFRPGSAAATWWQRGYDETSLAPKGPTP